MGRDTETLFAATQAAATVLEEAGHNVQIHSTTHWTTGRQDEESIEATREALRSGEAPVKVGFWVRSAAGPVVIVTGRAEPSPHIQVRGEGQDADLTKRAFDAASQIAFAHVPESVMPPLRESMLAAAGSSEAQPTGAGWLRRGVQQIEGHPVISGAVVLIAVSVAGFLLR